MHVFDLHFALRLSASISNCYSDGASQPHPWNSLSPMLSPRIYVSLLTEVHIGNKIISDYFSLIELIHCVRKQHTTLPAQDNEHPVTICIGG